MILCKELNMTFSNQKEMFALLKKHKRELIDSKKLSIKTTDPIQYTLNEDEEKKSISTEKRLPSYGDHVFPVINTTNWIDSHKDLHLNGIWDKSAKEQDKKVYYIVNHDLSIGKVIAYPENVEIMVKTMSWSKLGVSVVGQTQALIYKVLLTEIANKDAYEAIRLGAPLQNSVRMQYVKVLLAINSTEDYYKEEKANWDKYSPLAANPEALKDGYFWPVPEAKIYLEGSAVLFGSNSVTPVLDEEPKHIEPAKATHGRAATGTQLKQLKTLLKTFKNVK